MKFGKITWKLSMKFHSVRKSQMNEQISQARNHDGSDPNPNPTRPDLTVRHPAFSTLLTSLLHDTLYNSYLETRENDFPWHLTMFILIPIHIFGYHGGRKVTKVETQHGMTASSHKKKYGVELAFHDERIIHF